MEETEFVKTETFSAMNRRDALSRVAVLLGSTIVGGDVFLSGCRTRETKATSDLDFSQENLAFLDEVGETILPATVGSPGAKEAKIGAFMKNIVTDCYDEKDQRVFATAVDRINGAARNKYGMGFMDLDSVQRHDLLTGLAKEAGKYEKDKKGGEHPHYFTCIQQLTLWGYFSSEPGSTRALRYIAVPGKYEGDVPYRKGERAWA